MGSDAMKQHNDYLEQILSLMTKAETHFKALRSALLDELPTRHSGKEAISLEEALAASLWVSLNESVTPSNLIREPSLK